jgi:hypothetical protein
VRLLLCLILIAGTITTTPAHAAEHTLPPEMLFEGNPIDPTCVYAAFSNKRASGIEIKNSCEEIKRLQATDEGTAVTQSDLRARPNNTFGYNYDLGNGTHGYFFYQYIGKTTEGIVLQTSYGSGGSGSNSDLSVYAREGDTLHKIRHIAGGDRCLGGVIEARIEGAQLLYSHNVTPLGLYQKYIPDADYPRDLPNGAINCGAIIHAKDNTVQSVDLTGDVIIPDCFRKKHQAQVTSQKTLSDREARKFIQKLSAVCHFDETANFRQIPSQISASHNIFTYIARSALIFILILPALLFIRWLARRRQLPPADASSKLTNLKERRVSVFFNTHRTIGLIIFLMYSIYLLLSITSISLYFWFPCLIEEHYRTLLNAYHTLRSNLSTSLLPILALFSARSIYLVFNGLPIRRCTSSDKVFFGTGIVSFVLFIFFAAEILLRSTVSGGGCRGL